LFHPYHTPFLYCKVLIRSHITEDGQQKSNFTNRLDNLRGMERFGVISDKVLYVIKDYSFGRKLPLLLAIGVEVHNNWVGFHSTGRGINNKASTSTL